MIMQATVCDAWIVERDFNSYLHLDERLGGDLLTAVDIHDFSQCIDACFLQEFKSKRLQYTWCNK